MFPFCCATNSQYIPGENQVSSLHYKANLFLSFLAVKNRSCKGTDLYHLWGRHWTHRRSRLKLIRPWETQTSPQIRRGAQAGESTESSRREKGTVLCQGYWDAFTDFKEQIVILPFSPTTPGLYFMPPLEMYEKKARAVWSKQGRASTFC